jgi:hypothetical protein
MPSTPPSGPTPASVRTSQVVSDPFFELLYSSFAFLSFVVVVVSTVSRVQAESFHLIVPFPAFRVTE